MIDSHTLRLDDAQAPIDDCWNRIGVHGDKSCERLHEHIHCRNCEVHAAAATRLLDRYALHRELDEEQAAEEESLGETRSTLVFRLGDAWLGLATRQLVEVAPQSLIHSLPHQRSLGLLGVTNVRGALVACLSLVEVLGLEPGQGGPQERRVVPRMLIVASDDGPVVAPVDEVDGIHAIPLGAVVEAGRGAAQVARPFASGVVQWRGRSVTLLDESMLQQAIARSLG
ncbi:MULTISPECIES: chemotaxis protein CheW [Pseudomonas]|uniref:chemotaxis protein CheW n=1 Tax=Pseudomonas TaxID=286 RepID=UPI001622D597|nr:chemotaxis protein CheW [Pseudomonas sp. TUM22785]MBB4817020.1 chemotaxis-related protein WspD [Pseudomonas alcaligenes]WCD79286.1 chemotaxis protein CheW [Pseudomonas sp. TUM22785]